MKKNDSFSTVWYPYQQHKKASVPIEISSAKNTTLFTQDGQELIDAVSSWWCVIHGYQHPALDKALVSQSKKMSHVMLGGLSHKPAEQLAKLLVTHTPDGLNHVFFSDSGSVGCEVALKMAIQYWKNKNQHEKSTLISFKKAYHGDTTGVMALSDPEEGMHALFHGVLKKHYFLEAPRMGHPADAELLEQDIAILEEGIKKYHKTSAGVFIEPLMQAAGGFNMYSPVYLNALRTLCDKYDLLLIADEVATGLGRTGTLFACEQAGITPDIMVLGKGLTGGYMGLAATLATSDIFDAFYHEDHLKAFMHGPTFMGNPLACAVAKASVELCIQPEFLKKIKDIEIQLKEALLHFSHPDVKSTRVLGATGVIEVFDPNTLQGVQEFATQRGVWLRPFGTYLYTMPPYVITRDELSMITSTMTSWFEYY